MRWLALAAAVAVLALIVFNLCYRLPDQVVAPFDEGRHIASALEMRRTHDFLVNRYQGRPDYYNAKPPLSMWAAALGVGLLPDPFVGVRLFSLLAALGTALLVYVYARRLAGHYAGLLAALLLMVAPLLLLKHGARTADPDMLYVFLVTAALLDLSAASRAAIARAWVWLGLAFLTKSFHAAPFMIAAMAWQLGLRWRGRLTTADCLRLPLCWLLPVLPWALARYGVDGLRFFHVMVYYDLVARVSNTVETHFEAPTAYVDSLLAIYGPALLSVAICLFAAPARRLLRDPRLLLALLWLALPLLLYSLARSRLYWYVFPLLPPAAILIASSIVSGVRGLHRVAVAVALVVLGFNVVMDEQAICQLIGRYSWADAPLQRSLRQVSAAAAPGVRVGVFMPDRLTFSQANYATLLLLGNLDLRGTDQDFSLRARPGEVELLDDGSVVRAPLLAEPTRTQKNTASGLLHGGA